MDYWKIANQCLIEFDVTGSQLEFAKCALISPTVTNENPSKSIDKRLRKFKECNCPNCLGFIGQVATAISDIQDLQFKSERYRTARFCKSIFISLSERRICNDSQSRNTVDS